MPSGLGGDCRAKGGQRWGHSGAAGQGGLQWKARNRKVPKTRGATRQGGGRNGSTSLAQTPKGNKGIGFRRKAPEDTAGRTGSVLSAGGWQASRRPAGWGWDMGPAGEVQP